MINIDEILANDNVEDIISALKERTTTAPNWNLLVTEYEPTKHPIVEDNTNRKDKIRSDGTKEEAARLTIGLEKLLAKRMSEFTFAIPVKRTYSYAETNKKGSEIEKAIERIYAVAHTDSENKKRALAYYASCEILTIWYPKKEEHDLYGFHSNFKLKCKTFSPMDDVTLWPLIDEVGEMYAMSLEYRKKVKDTWTNFFETYTADKHRVWQKAEGGEWEEKQQETLVSIGKIPAIYLYREHPVWHGLCPLRHDLEYSLSRNSDVIAYNSAPILKVAGSIVGSEDKGESRRVYRVTEGGDVSYVSWSQSIAALTYHVDTLLDLFWSQAQIPDISFEKMRGLGNIGYDARKTLLTDAHLKIGDESGPWIEFLEREGNVIKAFLKELGKIADFTPEDIDNVLIQHTITPFIQEDMTNTINNWSKASGGKALVSHLDAIKGAHLTDDPEKSYNDILAEELLVAAGGAPTEEGEEPDNTGTGEAVEPTSPPNPQTEEQNE